MTWGELRSAIRDLGFEDDLAMQEYSDIVLNAVNRAINIINNTVVLNLESYLKGKDPEYERPDPEKIEVDTEDLHEIELPDIVLELVPLLASHYVWLDDDLTKATYYWNEYDDLKNQIMQACANNIKATIEGGYRF